MCKVVQQRPLYSDRFLQQHDIESLRNRVCTKHFCSKTTESTRMVAQLLLREQVEEERETCAIANEPIPPLKKEEGLIRDR